MPPAGEFVRELAGRKDKDLAVGPPVRLSFQPFKTSSGLYGRITVA